MPDDNYPPGVSAFDIPGVTSEDRVAPLNCEAPRLYVDAKSVYEAIQAVAEDQRSIPSWKSARRVAMDAADRVLADRWVRVDEIDPTALCTFHGDWDWVAEHGTMTTICPTCGREYQREDTTP